MDVNFLPWRGTDHENLGGKPRSSTQPLLPSGWFGDLILQNPEDHRVFSHTVFHWKTIKLFTRLTIVAIHLRQPKLITAVQYSYKSLPRLSAAPKVNVCSCLIQRLRHVDLSSEPSLSCFGENAHCFIQFIL